jgi:glycosyltransferase involved in cell wall biosynthesis
MRILFISNEIRHELGCASSLQMLGYDVTYMHLGDKNEPLQERNAYTDQGSIKVNFIQIDSPMLFQSIICPQNFIPDEIREKEFDLVVTTPSTPFYIAYYLSKKAGVPLILRIWGIRAFTMLERIFYGKVYSEIIQYIPSLLHNEAQAFFSDSVVFLDHYTFNKFKKISLNQRLFLVYPTYSKIENNFANSSRNIKEIIEKMDKNYIFAIISTSRKGASFRIRDLPLLKIIMLIAKHVPVDIVIAGAHKNDILSILNLNKLPSNIHCLGYIASNNVLELLYKNAALVIIAPVFKSLSNRLLEALFYARPILTNSNATLLYPELKHLHHIFISDNYIGYPNIVRILLRNDILLERLASGAKEAYSSFFSARRCGLTMKRIIESLISK